MHVPFDEMNGKSITVILQRTLKAFDEEHERKFVSEHEQPFPLERNSLNGMLCMIHGVN